MLVLNQLNGFGVKNRRVPLETLTFTDSASNDGGAGNPYTFSGMSLGAAHEGRRIIVCYQGNEAGHNLDAVSVGGVAAEFIAEYQFSTTIRSEIWIADVPDGTTGDVVLTGTSSVDWAKIVFLYALDSVKEVVETASDAATTFTFTRTFNDNEFYVGLGRSLSTTSETYTNATEDGALALAGRTRASVASYGPATSGSRTITFTPSSSTSAYLLSAVFG
jgi:hypothetical protein